MEENHNSNNGMLPQMRPAGPFLAFWSVLLGGIGLVTDCLPLFSIWSLPAGLFFGLLGIACAVLSRQGKPFTQQAQLGLILSVISAVCGLLMTLFIIFVYDTMDTNTPLGQYFRQVFETTSQALKSTYPAGE
ncbi:sodium:solute symporter [Clostridium sp. Marseille-P2415]|uniref:sodium:solute symporter n=1 Tax=Clostridium sp. Marseille-P2415 TaxID=1805471 RepID=UPI00098894F9|nr:sodium:solute symporter [Clostridium sp. Marseille-P2415]